MGYGVGGAEDDAFMGGGIGHHPYDGGMHGFGGMGGLGGGYGDDHLY